ncbi:hypothetical protein DFH11DRAFT_1842577 [Phellopilus nigrolimitatus]|nr:hypothetical protein DFH11DRAFT_1842577 [Phellopilus nigrolimitatus]
MLSAYSRSFRSTPLAPHSLELAFFLVQGAYVVPAQPSSSSLYVRALLLSPMKAPGGNGFRIDRRRLRLLITLDDSTGIRKRCDTDLLSTLLLGRFSCTSHGVPM